MRTLRVQVALPPQYLEKLKVRAEKAKRSAASLASIYLQAILDEPEEGEK